MQNEQATQGRYYAGIAESYDSMYLDAHDEHYFALSFLVSSIDFLKITSILDIGSGTGRAIRYIKSHRPDVRIVGVEPVKELREIGYSHGLTTQDLMAGDALDLQYESAEFDLVCEFGVLHHIKTPDIAVAEMLRVADKAVFISDCNNFGQGSFFTRSMKQALNSCGLWKLADLARTGGRGFMMSEGDGLYYSYSVFNNYDQIKSQCSSVHVLNTSMEKGNVNPYRTSTHVALLGLK